ncbi:MAG: hypothetical protein E7399_04815 [Ruminococcaceae bacterium]|nr:hypothetical protein [Oscillospiraceae bacterium]
MNNIPINEAETIFEPYWDSGESYPCKRKYSVYEKYTTTVHPKAVAKSQKTWCNVTIQVEKGVGMEEASCTISRDCDLILDGYDLIQCNASFAKNARMVIGGVIDGEERLLMDSNGFDQNREIQGEISGHKLTKLSISFYCEKDGSLNLFWLGLANQRKLEEMLEKKTAYSTDWEGCFEEHPKSLNPRVGVFANAEQLEELRRKTKHSFFREGYEKLKQNVERYREIDPEQFIGKYVPTKDIRWIRDRDRIDIDHPSFIFRDLLTVGAIEQDEELLRLGARWALSLSCCENWCEGIMGCMPGVTWHHRSFTEEWILHECAMALDFAGHLLTWHGRNIIHNAIILKGLSRMEADFHMMEYIHHMNQGIVFCKGWISALAVLSYDYPRFRSRVDEAEKILEEALERYIFPDGGCKEGPGYLGYTISETLGTYYLLANYRKQKYEEYLPDSILRGEQFFMALRSTVGDGTFAIANNDTHLGATITSVIAAVYSGVGNRQTEWTALYEVCAKKEQQGGSFYSLALGRIPEKEKSPWIKPNFWNMKEIGHSVLIQQTEDCGLIRFHAMAGPKIFSHCHSDSGSILLEAAGESFMMDLGSASYSSPFTRQLQKAISHNLFVPLNPGGFSYDQKQMSSAKTVHSEQKDGVFTYTADLLTAWEKGIFRKNFRRIFSPEPHVYLIMDETEYETPLASSFLFVTDKPAEERSGGVVLTGEKTCVTVTPLNWTADIRIEHFDGNHEVAVNRVWMNTDVAPSHKIMTAITVAPKGEEVALNLTAQAVEEGFSVIAGEHTYVAKENGWEIK